MVYFSCGVWYKRYLRGGAIALINNKNISPGQLKKGMETPSSDQDIRQLSGTEKRQ